MANPTTKNGFIPIANELAEQLAMVNIPGNEMRIVWVVWRQTWGYKNGDRRKDWDWISFSQLEKKTGMKRANCFHSVKELLCKRLIVKVENGYKFNQNYNEWVLAKRLTVCKSITPVMQKHNKSVMQKHNESVMQKTTYKRKKENKENITKENGASAEKKKERILSPSEEVMDVFYQTINPGLNWGNKTNRSASEWLVKKFPQDAVRMAQAACAIQGKQYAPTVTTPYQLKEKLGELKIYFDREKNKANQFKGKNYDE